MPGPAPKPAGTRSRRNKTSTAATLRPDPELTAPDLPDVVAWHDLTVAWWRDVWASPMAPEYDESDKHGLYALAMLVNDFWSVSPEKAYARMNIAAEIRQQSQRFGLSPIDRRRLQWEICKAEDAEDRTAERRSRRPVQPSSQDRASDPRNVLRAVE